MSELSLKNEENEYREKLLETYLSCKKLFIRTEEILPQMSFFVAPMIEHSDALDHMMRYLCEQSKGNEMKALKELDRALAHEVRAFFDVADYACIIIRDAINNSLKGISKRNIKKIWKDYIDLKTRVLEVSEKIAKIRNDRNGSVEYIKQYEPILDEVFEVYKKYSTDIEPKIKSFSWWKK